MRASWNVVWAIGLIALAVADCGGSGHWQNNDASLNTDTQSRSDVLSLDHTGGDSSSDAIDLLCVVPTDCPAFLTCCVKFDGSGSVGAVNCQASCVPDQSTWLVCATDTDCPATLPMCVDIATAPNGRPFKVCES